MTDQSLSYRWIEGQGLAFGAPGFAPTWTSSEKDAVGTAYSSSSRIWYTISHGILNEIYYPTIDRPQTRDMELLLTDGETFFHEEKRDLDRTFEHIDDDALAARLINRDRNGRYRVTKEIISDPHHPVVLMRVRLEGDEDLVSRMKVYALLAPHLEVGGYGNSGGVLDVAGKRVLLAWKSGISLVMAASCGFSRTSCGYVGHSDGWQDIAGNFKMDWEFGSAVDGNIALTGEIPPGAQREFVVAMALGQGHHAALTRALGALNAPFEVALNRFIEQWHRVATPVDLMPASTDSGRLLQISHNTILGHEDKTFPGAFIASASFPWGQSQGDDDLGGYHLVWTRDMVQSASSLLYCGHVETAQRALLYLACTQKVDGSFAQNFWIDGTPYWQGIQLDEVAFPIVLAWRLWKRNGLGMFEIFPFVERAAGFLMRSAPVTQQERWEENAGYSPSTLAVVIAALVCAADIARAHDAAELAGLLEEHADWIQAHLEDWTVTDQGVLLPEVKRHYMRIRPPECGDPYEDGDCGREIVRLNNQPPGAPNEFEAREIIDAGFLELVRYGVRRADDPLIVDSLKVVDHVLKVETPFGPCWRRYNHDGYGQKDDGGPFSGWGVGRAWPLLTGERAHYELAAGRDVKPYITALERFSSAGGMMPEQIWDGPSLPEAGMEPGRPTGSAMPLVWAHAEYIKLLRSVTDGKVADCISIVEARYGEGRRENTVEIFRLDRKIKHIEPGKTLRVFAQDQFHLIWTPDDWKTIENSPSWMAGYAGYCADIATAPGQTGKIIFTLHWFAQGRWQGENFEVELKGKTAPVSSSAKSS
ncbi:MAG TPA: glycoside hydrolase family 15 protein [Acidobacteriaceae bacterium]|nr:glycoside hydrolase family 15 protein [Acidobacteriaceae bacterium]